MRSELFKMSRSSVTCASSFFSPLISAAWSSSPALDTFENFSGEVEVLAYTHSSLNLRYRIVPLGNLQRRVSFEILTEISSAHYGLLASKLRKKVTMNLGVIQAVKIGDSE